METSGRSVQAPDQFLLEIRARRAAGQTVGDQTGGLAP
jgi:hypothetical protein